MKLHNKFLTFFIFFFLFIILSNCNVFATNAITYIKKCQSCDITFENTTYDISTISNSSSGKHLTNILIIEHDNKIYAIAYFSTSSSVHNNNMYLKTYNGITYPYVDNIYNTDIFLYNGTSFVYQGWDGANFDRNGYSSIITNGDIIYSSEDIYTNSNCDEIYFKAGGIDNNYNYDDYVLPELPENLYKYNYIIKATVSSSEGTGTIYMLHSHSSPIEFYNGGCSSCQEDCSSDCPDTPISYCDHILSAGNVKVYTYAPSEYPSNDIYGGNSLWTLFSDEYYFSSNWEHHFHWGTSLKDVLVYSDFTISPKDSSGNVVDVLDPNNYDDFKDDVIDNNSDYVINENYYNNVVDKSFLDTIIDFINNFFKNIKRAFQELFKSIFIPQDGYFETQIKDIKNKLNEKTHYQDYLDSLKEIESITDATGDTDEITTHIDLNNYSITDKLTINMSKFIDFSIFNEFKSTWYSWVRVVTYIGLVIYNINQIIKLFNGFGAVEGSIRDVQNIIMGSDKR